MLRSSVLWAIEQGFSDKIDFYNVSEYKSLIRRGEVSQANIDNIAKINKRDMLERHIDAAHKVDSEHFNHLSDAYSVATDQPEQIYERDPTFFWRDGSSWKLSGSPPITEEAHSCIAISVSAVLFRVWNEPAKGKMRP